MGDSGTATTRERPLIGAAQQVRHLKDRGVRFELTDERKAERLLRESYFFFKVKAFAKCFSRYTNPDSEHFGSYINLDFAHLAELTRLDHHLRETVLSLTLDIEHYMKVELNRMTMDAGDDPYELMAPFFNSERERKVRVLEKRVDLDSVRSKAPTVMGLSGDLAAQDAETVISALASILHLASDSLDGIDPNHTERSLAGLGGSSYTRGLVEKYGDPGHMAVEELGIDRELVSLTKRAPIVHDFTALALCYTHIAKSENARGDAAGQLRALRRRFMAHRDYFSKQGELKNGLDMLSEVMGRTADRLSRP